MQHVIEIHDLNSTLFACLVNQCIQFQFPIKPNMNNLCDPLGHPTITAGSDNCFAHVVRPSVRKSVPTFQNIAEQNKFLEKTMFLAEWITDDACFLPEYIYPLTMTSCDALRKFPIVTSSLEKRTRYKNAFLEEIGKLFLT